MRIITHRGLRPLDPFFFSESSYEAFSADLTRGFAIEFDVGFTIDGIVITHDSDLHRLTQGYDERLVTNLTTAELLAIPLDRGHLCPLEQLLELIRAHSVSMNALHFKGIYQSTHYADRLIQVLSHYQDVFNRLFIFDVKPDIARQLKIALPQIQLGASVAHSFDIKRYQSVVYGTLLPLEQVLSLDHLYDWIWLDEWDLSDETGLKKLYTPELLTVCRSYGFRTALVSPELHGTSPGLLGGEWHPDALTQASLLKRLEELVALHPDAICTDYPDELENLIFNTR